MKSGSSAVNRKRRLLFAGYLNLDVIAFLDHEISRGERLTVDRLQYSLGGMTSNAACVSASLGEDPILFATVGRDSASEFVLEELQRWGVNTDYILRDPLRSTTRCLITVYPDGDRSIISERLDFEYGPLQRFLLSEEAAGAAVLHVDGYRLVDCADVVSLAKSRGLETCVDLDGIQDHPEIGATRIELFDHVILNRGILELLTGTASLELGIASLPRRSDQIFVITLGGDGVVVAKGDWHIRFPGLKVEVVDTTGAGDAFVGAYVAGLGLGLSLKENIERSNRVGAISTLGRGALGHIPSLEAVSSFVP